MSEDGAPTPPPKPGSSADTDIPTRGWSVRDCAIMGCFMLLIVGSVIAGFAYS